MLMLRAPIAIAVVVVAMAVCVGCASQTVPGATSSSKPTSTSASDATAEAVAMVDAAVVPPGARQSSRMPAVILSKPAQRPACTPLVDKTSYRLVPNTTLDDAVVYLKAHPTRSLRYQDDGHMTTSGVTATADVVEAKPGATPVAAALVYTLAPIADGAVGIRIDSQVIPPHASCAYSGGGAAISGG